MLMIINFIVREGGNLLRTVNEEARRTKTIEIMEKCFDCYAENGFTSVGVKAIADACSCSVANLYQYFDNLTHLCLPDKGVFFVPKSALTMRRQRK